MLAISPTDYDTVCQQLAEFLRTQLNLARPGTVERSEDFDSQDWQPSDFPLLKVFRTRWQGALGSEAQVRIYYIVSPSPHLPTSQSVDFNWVVKSIYRLLEVFEAGSDCVEIGLNSIVARYQVLQKETVFPFVQFDFVLKERG